ncbi:SOUL heme-binding protein [Halovivax ruber XH-70]|uniref:SOUL heme-binding protein n=1 Tax=Halovivax ruber (strain DSM 18193 / JCM 13892 / XH-70) TaxID=797302 RepID=L0IC36_HALRX|nr:heme-binding protein [Halovivax ruber]AGB15532.1 SOUL heme-binding protein [Halovivax ruber XH-70]
MRSLSKAALVGAAALTGWIAWGVYTTRSTEAIPYARRRSVDGLEIRTYPQTVRVETTASNQREAFRRLYRYITGANEGSSTLSMTRPVESRRGDSIAMTAPVRTETREGAEMQTHGPSPPGDDKVRLSFYLPPSIDPESAPKPTDLAVSLAIDQPRTVAVKRFSWYTPAWRVDSLGRTLLRAVERAGYEPVDAPFLLRYDDPWTPPFMRRNEVAVEVDASP